MDKAPSDCPVHRQLGKEPGQLMWMADSLTLLLRKVGVTVFVGGRLSYWDSTCKLIR